MLVKVPPFCPNPKCVHHHGKKKRGEVWYDLKKSYFTKSFGWIKTFQCRDCDKYCSQKTFHFEYWIHRRVRNRRIFDAGASCTGVRQLARELGCSKSLIANRQARLARQSLAFTAEANELLPFNDEFTLGGFPSFTLSKFFPNTFHVLGHGGTQYIHTLAITHHRRTGEMTRSQQKYRDALDKLWKPRRGEVTEKVMGILGNLSKKAMKKEAGAIVVHSDERLEYAAAIESLNTTRGSTRAKIIQEKAPTAETKTGSSPLFIVNYLDKEFRKNLSEHVHHTTRFAQRAQPSMERMAIAQAYHNFFKPFRIKEQLLRDRLKTHGEYAGLDWRWIEKRKETLFQTRVIASHTPLDPMQKRIWDGAESTPLKPRCARAAHLRK